MTKPDIRMSHYAFEQMIETFSHLEEDMFDICECVAISNRLLRMMLDASERSAS